MLHNWTQWNIELLLLAFLMLITITFLNVYSIIKQNKNESIAVEVMTNAV